jgi:hypothetical protein
MTEANPAKPAKKAAAKPAKKAAAKPAAQTAAELEAELTGGPVAVDESGVRMDEPTR